MKARNRPPRLDERPAQTTAAVPPPTPEQQLTRARIVGKVANPGPRELRHQVDKLDANPVEAWSAIGAVFGATHNEPQIDAACTVRAARAAGARIGAVARAGGRIAFATAQPASLLMTYTALSGRAQEAGGSVEDADDAGPMRVDGRGPRWLRWLDGVAVVTDGTSVLATTGPEAADEWLFLSGRPSLVVADGPFAVGAVAAGIDTVAIAGLERVEFALPAARAKGCVVLPVHTGRPARAYRALTALVEDAFRAGPAASGPEL
jgi:Phosphatase